MACSLVCTNHKVSKLRFVYLEDKKPTRNKEDEQRTSEKTKHKAKIFNNTLKEVKHPRL